MYPIIEVMFMVKLTMKAIVSFAEIFYFFQEQITTLGKKKFAIINSMPRKLQCASEDLLRNPLNS